MSTGTTMTKPSLTNGVMTLTFIRPGIVDSCNKFHMVVEGDECHAIANSNGITLEPLVSWNPEVKTDCSSLWLGYYICGKVIGVTPSPATTTGPTDPTNGIETPTPILPGMVDNCDKFHMVVDDDQCGNIAQKYGISWNQFTTWNPQIGSGCSGLWLGYYVCVKIIGVAPTTTTTTTTYCRREPEAHYHYYKQWHRNTNANTDRDDRQLQKILQVVDGDSGETIAKKASITLANFYLWNTGVGSSCQTLWLGYYICTGVK
ncbi:uncharacterized protein BDW43DRAFT_317486 [Aspergillus alliaceus]|uniref:uncharacterized protein n=1 Tax=Petromyces alliaceus TaxID=209559 RepID=UPI0012A6CF2F|nr:uncharacterized protein BDW43DRAFT_317486 [Aspergillus alliaceus]KAB8226799.1 hypothetical protein BDW43DRAFT_317486 [Aspergillus alliaceus]